VEQELWSSVVPGTAPLVGISPRNPSTPGGRGRPARQPEGPHRLIGAPSGGGTPTPVGSPIPSVRPPGGARPRHWAEPDARLMGGGWVRGRDRGCRVGIVALPAPPSRAHPFPWGPSRGARRHVYLPACPRVLALGQFPSVPPGGPGGSVYPPARSRVPVSGRWPSVRQGGPQGLSSPGEVPPALRYPPSLALPSAGGRASGGPRQGGPARKSGVWLPTGRQGRLRVV